jgi:hypothetical protein
MFWRRRGISNLAEDWMAREWVLNRCLPEFLATQGHCHTSAPAHGKLQFVCCAAGRAVRTDFHVGNSPSRMHDPPRRLPHRSKFVEQPAVSCRTLDSICCALHIRCKGPIGGGSAERGRDLNVSATAFNLG